MARAVGRPETDKRVHEQLLLADLAKSIPGIITVQPERLRHPRRGAHGQVDISADRHTVRLEATNLTNA